MGKEFRHLRILREQLQKNTDSETQEKILSGLETVNDRSSPETKAQWAVDVTNRMDDYLPEEIRHKVREQCACLYSNEKSIYARTFRRLRKEYSDDAQYLSAVVDYLNATAPLLRCGVVSL
ncbi:MAG: hypothetical protein FWD16_07340, partial [Clostridia bacterium]|nr:hypothetical protein [Clostridia bacterium]